MRCILFCLWSLFILIRNVSAQNIGIGTVTPQAKLHINGDLKLQNGVSVNKFSTDSTFKEESHSNIPTEKAIKDYLTKGFFLGNYPQVPTLRGTTTSNLQNPSSIAINDHYAYVTSRDNDMLCVFDINDPDNPVLLSSSTANLDEPASVAVQGNFAYVCSNANDRFCVFDITNPFMIGPRSYATIPDPVSVAVFGNTAYVIALGSLNFFDISDPDNVTATGGTAVLFPQDIFVEDGLSYVTSAYNNRLCIFSGSTLIGYTSVNLFNPRGLVVRNNIAYVASDYGLSLFDISDPTNIIPKDVGSGGGLHAEKVSLDGRFAYLFSQGEISVIDISNADSMLGKGSMTDLMPGDVYSVSGRIYVASWSGNKLCIYEQTNLFDLNIDYNGITAAPPVWFNRSIDNADAYTLKQKIGIGTRTPNAPLSFPGIPGKKIVLYQGTSDDIGLEVSGQPTYLRIHSNQVGSGISLGYYAQGTYYERMRINGSGNVIDVAGGAYCTGMSWNNASDSTLKDNIKPVNTKDILNKIAKLPINTWNYRTDPSSITHIGPMAQDFKSIFHTGNDEKTISTIDPSGVALAGIQALLDKIKELEKQVRKLNQQQKKKH